MMEYKTISGWGRTSPVRSGVVRGDERAVREALEAPGVAWAPRGMGRSYGDAAVNAGGGVLQLDGGGIEIDASTGRAVCTADVTIDDLIARAVPLGYFVPVTPGTRFVSLGGAVAADIHGKNHHRDGSIGEHVLEVQLLDGSGSALRLRPGTPEFDATVGGMGLTGLILEVTLQLTPIRSPRMSVDTHRVGSLVELMDRMREKDMTHRYSVAWIDVMKRGRRMGRGVLTVGDHLPDDEPLVYQKPRVLPIGRLCPPINLLSRLSATAFNEAWWRKAPKARLHEPQTIPKFFHPLDAIGDWNRLYGPRGFLQHQFCIPDASEEILIEVVRAWAASGLPSSLNVLKRFGPGSGRPLSFPTAGWTLTVDVPVVRSGILSETLSRVDAMVLDAGGRHYLAKDAYLSPDHVRRGYPHLEEWRALRDTMDPEGRWSSDLGRRLGLVAPSAPVKG